MKQALKWVATITFLILSIVSMSASHAQAGVSGKSYSVNVHMDLETFQCCFTFAENGTFSATSCEGDHSDLSGQWIQEGIKFEVDAHSVETGAVFALTGISPVLSG